MKFVVTKDKQFLQLIDATDNELEQLNLSFTRKVENAKWKAKRNPYWNFEIKFMDSRLRIPFGLWDKIQEVADKYKFNLEFEGMNEVINFDFDEQDYINWENDFFKDSEKKPREFQTKTVIEILKWQRAMCEIATSAGKTLIIFCIFAYLKHKNLLNRMLVIVPNVTLVTQGIDDFEEFSKDRTLINYKIQAIGGGNSKIRQNVDIVIGTFQTLRDMELDFFEGIDCVIVDECHTAIIKSIMSVLKKVKANIRIGLSGTTCSTGEKSKFADSYTRQSLLGPIVNKVTPDYIIKKGYATPVSVKILYLDYLDEDMKEKLHRLKTRGNNDGAKILKLERDLVIENQKRFEFVTNMISKVSKNTLVFFTDIKGSYGKKIYDRLRQTTDNKFKIMYIDGSTKTELRDEYKNIMDSDDDRIKILVASYGTFSTGVSINNIHNIFLCESYKSEKIIKQTIGRGMRLHENKNVLNIIDIVDNFMYKHYKNFMVNHALEREQIYKTEKFKYEKFDIKI